MSSAAVQPQYQQNAADYDNDIKHSTPANSAMKQQTARTPTAEMSQFYQNQPTTLPIRSPPEQSSPTQSRDSQRQRTQRTPIDSPVEPGSGRSQRSRHTPQQSRSQTAIGMPPIGTDLPRENSAIINHIVVDDPSSDIARERARVQEAQPVAPGQDLTPVTGLGLVGDQSISETAQQPRSRQEHLKSASHRKEVKFGDYILGQTLGEGEFGKVKMGWKKEGGVQVAIKLIRKESLAGNTTRLPKIYREISILKELEHPNIVRLHEFVETERHMGIILEYASGGELFDYILNHRYLKDPAARRLFAQLVSGVGYLHKKGIVHRDLKLENLLLDRYKNIIITDFGFANTFNPHDELGEDIEHRISDKDFLKREGYDAINKNGFRRGDLMQTSCGSPCYAAPELVVSDGLYTGRKVDVWSCGVILYAMLAGYLPFDDDPANPEGDNINLLYKYIVSTPLTFPEYVTPHARDLLRRILVPDPRRRADLFEVARHSWLSEYSHLVGFIGSSSKSDRDIAKSAMRQDQEQVLGRSASVREPSTRSPAAAAAQKAATNTAEDARSRTSDTKRRTVQVEYVPPVSTQRAEASPGAAVPIAGVGRTRARAESQGPVEVTTLPQQTIPRKEIGSPAGVPSSSKRDTQARQDSAYTQQAASSSRPNTRGNLPSRGNSYSSPVIATPTTENAQGRFSQPKPNQTYMMGGAVNSSPVSSTPQERPGSHQAFNQFPSTNQSMPYSGGHKRSSTLGSITDRVLGRTNSRRKASQPQEVPSSEKRDRRYPPLSMNNSMAPPPVPQNDDGAAPRRSTDSRRSSFQFLRKNSDMPSDNNSTQQKRSSRRFSFFGNKNPQSDGDSQHVKRASITQRLTRPVSRGMAFGRGASRSPSRSTLNIDERGASKHQRTATLESALPPNVQRKQFRDDGFGGNLLDQQQQSQQQQSFSQNGEPQSSLMPKRDEPVERFYTPAQDYESMMAANNGRQEDQYSSNRQPQQQPQYHGADDGYGTAGPVDQTMSNSQSIRPQQRKFGDAYNQGHEGSSSGARRVMDFFRRRGKERGEHRN